jgi:LPXTG-motif cell wall-anchored protein
MNYARNSLLDKQLPAFLGVFVLLITLGITLLLSGNTLLFVTKATVGSDPKNIQISNLTATSFTISYTTDEPATGSISYGIDSTLAGVALDDRDQQASGAAEHQVHFITVKNLIPSTKYYYAIITGSQKAENGSNPFEITTAAQPQTQSTNATITGSVSLTDGSIPTEGIIYVTADNAQQLATLINADGTYQLPTNDLQGSSASTPLSPDTVLQLQAVTATQQSTAKVLLSQATQVPKIVLPQNYDFTLGPAQPSTEPSEEASVSGFPVLATPAPVTSPEITSPIEAQSYNDQRPLFTGMALPNTEVDITIQSQQEITVKMQSDSTGSWQFRPPVSLAPGKHTITISSLNAAGILQTISRSFTVYAQGSKFIEPSVSPVASPSAAPTPLVLPTAKPLPTATPTTTPTAAPTTHPTLGPTRGPLPKTGSSAVVTGIISGLSILGIGALLFFAL